VHLQPGDVTVDADELLGVDREDALATLLVAEATRYISG